MGAASFSTAPLFKMPKSENYWTSYNRARKEKAEKQKEWFETSIYSTDEAKRRSYMHQAFGNRPLGENTAILIGKKFRFRTSEKPDKTPWIEHVKDGKALTPHGARLLNESKRISEDEHR